MNFITTFERFTNVGQIFKVYSLNCPEHPSDDSNKFLPIGIMTEICQELTTNEPRNIYDIKSVTWLQIFQELKTSKFIGHSCIMFIINMNCDCRSRVLFRLFNVVKRNKYLRHKSKLFLASYHLREKKKTNFDPVRLMNRFYKYFNKFPIANKLYPKINEVTLLLKGRMFNYEYKEMGMALNDFHNFDLSNLDNTVIIQYFTRINHLSGENINNLLNQAYENHMVPMQQTLLDVIREKYPIDLRIISTSTNNDLYFYNINPALAFIINSYYFTSPADTRQGSEYDVINLIRALKIRGIPYVLIEDCSKEKLLEVLEYLEQKDFYPLQNFLYIMMSHGRSGNVIRTHDGQLDINDIAKRIQSNKSLKKGVKILAFNNCRGPMHIKYADLDELEMIKPTASNDLDENTVLVYSVPDGVKSLRSKEKGCPFPRNLSIQLKNSSPNDTVDAIFERVNEATRPYYYNRLPKCIELVRKNPKRSFNILPSPAVASAMIDLINSIENDLETILNSDGERDVHKTQFYVSGTRQKEIIEANPLFHYYFSPDLDGDQCDFEDEQQEYISNSDSE